MLGGVARDVEQGRGDAQLGRVRTRDHQGVQLGSDLLVAQRLAVDACSEQLGQDAGSHRFGMTAAIGDELVQ